MLKRVSEELDKEGEMTENHRKFIEVCDAEGLPRNLGKQLIRAMSGAMQGGEFDGDRGVLKVGNDKFKSFVRMSLVYSEAQSGANSA